MDLQGTFWTKSVDSIQEEFEEIMPQLIQLIQILKMMIDRKNLIQKDDLYQTFYPETIPQLEAQGLTKISMEINQWILEKKYENDRNETNRKFNGTNCYENGEDKRVRSKKINLAKPKETLENKRDWENTAKNLATLMKCLTNKNKDLKLRDKPSKLGNNNSKYLELVNQLKQLKGLKWKLKKLVNLNLQNSKIVKEIFYYNIKLINLPMTSQNKLINKLINLMTSSKIVKESHINKTRRKLTQIRMNIGKEWSQEKNYATLINRGVKAYENQDTINEKEIELQVCLENWNIQKLMEIINEMKKNEYKNIRWNLWKRIWNTLNYKKDLDQVKKWNEWFEKEKQNKEMDLDE
jgi:hypothetical protein